MQAQVLQPIDYILWIHWQLKVSEKALVKVEVILALILSVLEPEHVDIVALFFQ